MFFSFFATPSTCAVALPSLFGHWLGNDLFTCCEMAFKGNEGKPFSSFVFSLRFFVSGKYLVDAILKSARLELAFVWNRTCDVVRGKVDEKLILEDLSKFSERLVAPVWTPF